MRLIDTNTMAIELFVGKLPEYAILSHTWGEGEVSFQDFTRPDVQFMPGYAKIWRTCALAREAQIPYAWVDTCCIDKTSSAELSEAINSMFVWYARANITYVFLADWDGKEESLSECRWFTRGWTLQELVAPENIEFYDASWIKRGTKQSLAELLTEITGIDREVLAVASRMYQIPVGCRMAWAAHRQTTRDEDLAYCLLGIFDVNMPMLYGEGKKAFIRLQEAILAQTNDLSLFAWTASSVENSTDKFRGILARSPDEFASIGELTLTNRSEFSEEYGLTNKGIRINTGLADSDKVLPLDCMVRDGISTRQLGIYLKKYGAGLYARESPDKLAKNYKGHWTLVNPAPIFIVKDLTPSSSAWLSMDGPGTSAVKVLQTENTVLEMFKVEKIVPRDRWDGAEKRFLVDGTNVFTGIIKFGAKPGIANKLKSKVFYIVCGKEDDDITPWVTLASEDCEPEMKNVDLVPGNAKQVIRSRDRKRLVLVQDGFTGSKIVIHLTTLFRYGGVDVGIRDEMVGGARY